MTGSVVNIRKGLMMGMRLFVLASFALARVASAGPDAQPADGAQAPDGKIDANPNQPDDATKPSAEPSVDAIKKHTAAQLLVVGNDPFLSWVLSALGCRVGLEHADVVVLERRSRHWPGANAGHPWSVAWVLMEQENVTVQ